MLFKYQPLARWAVKSTTRTHDRCFVFVPSMLLLVFGFKVFDFGVVAAPDALDPLCPVLTSGAPLPDWTSVRTDTTQTPAGSGPRCHSLQCDSSCHFLASDIGHASTRYNRLVFSSTIPPRSGQDSTPDSKSMSRLKEMAMDRREGAEGSRVAVLKSLLPPHSSTMLSVGSE